MKYAYLFFAAVFTFSAVMFFCRASIALETIASPPHNECPYEGAECPNAEYYMRSYQIDVYGGDSVHIYDGDRIVGCYAVEGNKLDSIILKDNE